MKKKKLVLILFLVFLFFITFLYLKDLRERRLVDEGDLLIEKIERFRSQHNRLPINLEDMGIKEKEEDQLHYNLIDSNRYIVSFGYGVGESIIFHSETGKWDDF